MKNNKLIMKLKTILSSTVLAASAITANAEPVKYAANTNSNESALTLGIQEITDLQISAIEQFCRDHGPIVLKYRLKTNGQRVHMRNQDGSLYTNENGVPQYFADGHTVSVDVSDNSEVNGKTLYRVFVKGQPTNKFIDSSLLNYEIK